ncbi:MAG: dihydroorotase [Bacteroidetes bacterium]|nr:dihydroorotase [Bacteroidota bacterium]
MSCLLRKVIVLDHDSSYHEKKVDVLIGGGKIQIGQDLDDAGCERIWDGTNDDLYLTPGFVDVFADYREPGFEQKETIKTGSATAAKGGFTDVFLLPNTKPTVDTRAGIDYVRQKSGYFGVRLHPLGAVSQQLEGKALAEMMDMYQGGAVAFSDGWKPIQNSGLMLKALEYVKAFDGVVIQLPMDAALASGGLMHEGVHSTRLGMAGIPAIAEALLVHRDIELCRYTDSRIHFTGISCKESLDLIRRAKSEQLKVTCSVTPYHLLLTDEALQGYDSQYKVTPPLRTEEDRQALITGLAEGTIDCISSHHRPQDWDAKAKEFEYAGEGMAVQELVLPIVLTATAGKVSLQRIVDALNRRPRQIFGLGTTPFNGTEKKGRYTLFSTKKETVFSHSDSPSLARNNPFEGIRLKGSVEAIFTN